MIDFRSMFNEKLITGYFVLSLGSFALNKLLIVCSLHLQLTVSLINLQFQYETCFSIKMHVLGSCITTCIENKTFVFTVKPR